MGPSQDERHVRIATPREFIEVAWVLARAFAHDPCLNWFGHVKQMLPTEIDNYNALPPKAKSTLKKLYAFQYALVRATALSGGTVTVAVVPSTEHDQTRDGAPKKEVIAGATLWLKPGQTLDFTLGTVIRSGLFKVPFAWGLTGAKRLVREFSPAVERSLLKSFKAHGADRLDSWHLLTTAVDPRHEGKGLCSLMMREGFERTAPKPVHLEASTARSCAIYSHFLFEVDEEHVFGKGDVDSRGLPAKGSEATGYQDWIMTKWKY